MPTERDVERLARWLYKSYDRSRPAEERRRVPCMWERVLGKDFYRAIARALLADPPAVLRRRVKELADA